MSTDSDNLFNGDTFKTSGQWTHQGSQNAGQWTATTGQPSPPQGSNESWTSYTTRQASHDYWSGQNNK